ncbi:MAG: hypothetical protein U0235_11495 [Polyangiaceae bacterium]
MTGRIGILSGFLLALAACSSEPATDTVDPATAPTTEVGSTEDEARTCTIPKTERKVDVQAKATVLATIKRIAAEEGVHNALLIAGIGAQETRLSQCWKDARDACQGPTSAACGGPVVAGAGDGPCSDRQGGLGMFQFDAGNYDETLRTYGKDILTEAGNVRAAVRLIVEKLRTCSNGPATTTPEATRAFIDAAKPGTPQYDVFLDAMAHCYNGAGEKTCRFQQVRAMYKGQIELLQSDAGPAFWN